MKIIVIQLIKLISILQITWIDIPNQTKDRIFIIGIIMCTLDVNNQKS